MPPPKKNLKNSNAINVGNNETLPIPKLHYFKGKQ